MTRIDDEFQEFVQASFVDLCRVGYLLCGDRHKAEDAAQEALLKVSAKWKRIDNRFAYARRAMVHLLIDESRRPWRREKPVEQQPEGESPDAFTPVDDRDELMRALAVLSPRQRACVVLRYYRDLSVADTAAALDISEGNVKRATFDGLRLLREALVPAQATRS